LTHRPRKRFGQNFLHDERVIYAIVSAIGPGTDEHLVEIGPGQGALTRLLLSACGQLDVIELDRDLVDFLAKRFAGEQRLRIFSGDAMRFDFSSLGGAAGGLRVIGNLPYNISTPLLFHLFDQSVCIKDMHFMLQKEVVDRLCAEPGGKDYGRLGVMAQYYCEMESLMEVGPESFNPMPKVTSAVVRLVPHSSRPVDISPWELNRVVAAAFSQRRKTLRNALANLLTADEIAGAGINPSARAETLSLNDFALLAKVLSQKTIAG
jgi:16S rRNA (adenine1518-N6/adenine1519-N6)-dimethyltransferase